MNEEFFRKSIDASFGFNHLGIEKPTYYNPTENNYGQITSKYLTMTVSTPRPQYYNGFIIDENKIEVNSNLKAPSFINPFNLNEDNTLNEQNNYIQYNENNYIRNLDNYNLTNFAYSEGIINYGTKEITPSVINFDIFEMINGQKLTNLEEIPQNNQTCYNFLINNYNYNTMDNYDIGILNNTEFMNNSNNIEILNENNNLYSNESYEINNAFLSTDIQEEKKVDMGNTEEIVSDNDLLEYFNKCNSGIVKDYAYYEEYGERNYMEDKIKVVENLNGDPHQIIFCIFDGHGGDKISKFLQHNFQIYMKKMLPFIDYENDFVTLFRQLDEEIRLLNIPKSGSTASIAYIENIYGKRILHCACIGDSRCILVKKNKVIKLSYDDRVEDPNEYNRIISQGGIIQNGRVNGTLMLSRCFGDWDVKKYGVIVDPHVTNIELTDDDLYLILATDGVWDVLTDEQCKDITKLNTNSIDICKNIVVDALSKGADDNISCIVVTL